MRIKKYTFHELISQQIIEIPIIQRDYAQGRTLENVTYIRNRFVQTLVNSVKECKSLHLGFVYGRIEGKDRQREMRLHKESVHTLLHSVTQYAQQFNIQVHSQVSAEIDKQSASWRFIPLDGQQRLTTLFLLYWYIAMRNGRYPEWLANFKYNNRKLALAFFEELTRPENIVRIHNELQENIHDQIIEYTWYLDKWEYDATVNGALVMLGAIHSEFTKFENIDFSTIKLEELELCVDFLDLEELKQTDELYIKMNERGKLLTDFEHFKAWLQSFTDKSYNSNEQKAFLKTFWKKLDTKWFDFFWKKIDVDFNAVDDFYFNYLKTLAITYHFANSPESSLPQYLKELLQKIRNAESYDKKDITYIPLSDFIIEIKKENTSAAFELFSYECLLYIDKSFDALIAISENNEWISTINDIVKEPFIAGNKEITLSYLTKSSFTLNYWDHVYYYFVLELYKKEKVDIKSWLRILRNIIYNTYVQSPENLFDALQSIRKLVHSGYMDIRLALEDERFVLNFFYQKQLKEEKLKQKLIKDGWEEKNIHQLENHDYFLGQIQFIFDLAKGNQNKFQIYGEILEELYGHKIEDTLLQQALLVQGDYLIKRTNYSFCRKSIDSLRSRNDNWRQVFNDEIKLDYLKILLDSLLENSNTFLDIKLKEIIKAHKFKIDDWQYYFLENDRAIKECKYNEIRWFNEHDIRLLHSSTITGFHLELRTICLFQAIEDKKLSIMPFAIMEYLWDKKTDGHPGIGFKKFNFKGKDYQLDIHFSKDGSHYELCFYQSAETIDKREFDDELKENFYDFEFNINYNHFIKLVEIKDIFIELAHILMNLNK